MKLGRHIGLILLVAAVGLLLTGCKKDHEEKIIGKWKDTKVVNGISGVETFTFREDKTFTQAFLPADPDKFGSSVEGTWEIDFVGDLKLHYDESSVKTISLGVTNPLATAGFIKRMKHELRAQNSEGGVLPLNFSDDNSTLTIITSEGTREFERVTASDDDDSENMEKSIGSNSRSGFALGDKLPTESSLQQFDVLSQHELTESDVTNYSSYKMRIMRNAIFARHHYAFKSEDLQYYFSNFDDYSPEYSEVTLTPTEQYNVSFLKRHE